MKPYTWEDYYDHFYDWAESTRVRNLSGLTSLGPADEVAEIIIEMQDNLPAANRLLAKAVGAKLSFSVDDLILFLSINDKSLATAAIYNSAERLTAADMEDLYGVAEDDDIIAICTQRHLALPKDLRQLEEEPDVSDEPVKEVPFDDAPAYEEPRKLGFFAALFAALGFSGAWQQSRTQRHNGRCNGDCANCPAHYGYRYGRWYYSHGHTHGCQFGGNKGDGRL